MSQTTTSDGLADHRSEPPIDQGGDFVGSDAKSGSRRLRPLRLVAGSVLCVVALVLLAGGGWALWKDRVDRDSSGFVSLGTTELKTRQYAIVGDLKGDGPSWLYGSSVLGDERVRASSRSEQPVFIGIARKDDVLRYLNGAGYATVSGFEVSAKSTHPGGPPPGPPSNESIWATSTKGTGERTLLWSPRSGDWSIVLMNADASANVDVRGDASAKLPLLPWVAGGLLFVATVAGLAGALVIVRTLRDANRPTSAPRTSIAAEAPVGERN